MNNPSYTLWQVIPDGRGEYEEAELDRGVSIPNVATNSHMFHEYLERNGWITSGTNKWDTSVLVYDDGSVDLEDTATGRALFRLTPKE